MLIIHTHRSHWYVAFICYPGLFDSDNIPKHQTRSMLSTQARKVQRRTKQARPKSMPLIEALDSQVHCSVVCVCVCVCVCVGGGGGGGEDDLSLCGDKV